MRGKYYWTEKMLRVILLIFIFLISFNAVYRNLPQLQIKGNSYNGTNFVADKNQKKPLLLKDTYTCLLLASDSRFESDLGRSDSLMLVRIDTNLKRAIVLSIPRDTLVLIPGYGRDKINSAIAYGGIPLAKATVEKLLNTTIDYYFSLDFSGFIELVDLIGGVPIDIEKNMLYLGVPEDSVNLKKGFQVLNGEQALQYVRYRSDELGDISRTQRQQKFVKALVQQATKVNNIWKLPSMIPQLRNYIQTDMSPPEMLAMVLFAREFNPNQLISQTLPGNFSDINGVSYWVINEKSTKMTIDSLMSGELKNMFDPTAGARLRK